MSEKALRSENEKLRASLKETADFLDEVAAAAKGYVVATGGASSYMDAACTLRAALLRRLLSPKEPAE